MRIGIIGSGNIGGTAARLFIEAGHKVGLSHKGPKEALSEYVQKLGPNACAMNADEAIEYGDVILLALPWRNRDEIPRDALRGKIVIDAMNPYKPDHSLYDLGNSTSSEEVKKALPGARIVKAFNTMFAKDLATRGNRNAPVEDRLALFVAGDDEEAKAVVSHLIFEMGFAPVLTGGLRDGGRMQQPGSPIYTKAIKARDAVRAVVDLGKPPSEEPHPATEPAPGP